VSEAAGGAERVEITGIAAGGAGVGRLADGRAVFVHRTAPGELVELRVTKVKAGWAAAELLRVVRPAAARRPAPCPHYDRCGGCTLEHLEYGAQLDAKANIVAEALRRIAGLDPGPPEVVASPKEFGYRNRVSFTLRRLGGSRVVAGFHELGAPARVLDVTAACLLPEPAVAESWGRLRRAWGPEANRLPAGRQLRLTLRSSTAGAVALIVEGGYSPGRPDELLAAAGLASIWHRAAGSDALRLLAGEEMIQERWDEAAVELSGTVFLQINREAAALLERHVVDVARTAGGRRVVDAYCGIGLHARRVAEQGFEVLGIEVDAAAVEEARRAAPAGASFTVGRVEDRLKEALPADLVILNPPRTGLEPGIPPLLLEQPPARLIYVSCDPATLARDLERLSAGYTLRSLRCFDLFPQTSHVETVAELTAAAPHGAA
jgi:23S rRNA (uracil1939-C5)-methyltransferase